MIATLDFFACTHSRYDKMDETLTEWFRKNTADEIKKMLSQKSLGTITAIDLKMILTIIH